MVSGIKGKFLQVEEVRGGSMTMREWGRMESKPRYGRLGRSVKRLSVHPIGEFINNNYTYLTIMERTYILYETLPSRPVVGVSPVNVNSVLTAP